MGVTRTRVSAEKCGVRPDECCRCFYDAYWTCEDGRVVCKATITGGVEQTVGDLVTPGQLSQLGRAREARLGAW